MFFNNSEIQTKDKKLQKNSISMLSPRRLRAVETYIGSYPIVLQICFHCYFT
jgi:hypothetical protein